MIHSVKGLKIGDTFNIEGVNFIVTNFPTRYSVCGRHQKWPNGVPSGEPASCKVSRKSIKFYCDHKTDNVIIED